MAEWNSPGPSSILKTQCSTFALTEENRGTTSGLSLLPHFFSGRMSQSLAELPIQQSCHWLYNANLSLIHFENYVIGYVDLRDLSSSLTNITINAEGPLGRELRLGNYRHSWPILLCLLCFYFILIMGSNCVPERKKNVSITIHQWQRNWVPVPRMVFPQVYVFQFCIIMEILI